MGKRAVWRLNPGTTYKFLLRARKINGEYGTWAEAESITLDSVPKIEPPEKVEAWPFPLLNYVWVFWSRAKLEQGRKDIVSYKVYRSTENNSAKLTDDNVIADVMGHFHIDYSKDFKGVANAGSTGSTLINTIGRFKPTMVGEKILNKTNDSSGTITAVSSDGTTITAALSGGNTWSVLDKYIIDYTPLRNIPYFYWVKSVMKDGVVSEDFSEVDVATLGRPEDAVIDLPFAEDESEDFLWLKGWKMSFHCPDGAEGYHVTWHRQDAPEWAWAPLTFTPHIGEPDDTQTYVFKNKVVGVKYDFAVRAVNHLVLKDYWQEDWTIEEDVEVTDASSPQPPKGAKLFQGLFNNWITWTLSNSHDVKSYQIFRTEDDTEPTGADLLKPHVKAWPGWSSLFIDPLAGSWDRTNWRYWIRAEDWAGNFSGWSGNAEGEAPLKEVSVPNPVTIEVTPRPLGNLVEWDGVEDAKWYRIYRSSDSNLDHATCIAYFWKPTKYLDLLHYNKGGKTWTYWVQSIGLNGLEGLFAESGASGIPSPIDLPSDTINNLGMDRLDLNYETISLEVSNRLDLFAKSELGDAISGISITPQNISLYSTGKITIDTDQYLEIINSGDLKLDAGTIHSSSDRWLRILPNSVTNTLDIGLDGSKWQNIFLNTSNCIINSSGILSLNSTGVLRICTPKIGIAGTKLRTVYADADGFLKVIG